MEVGVKLLIILVAASAVIWFLVIEVGLSPFRLLVGSRSSREPSDTVGAL